MQCINLREQFGQQYRITFDPAYDPKHRRRDNLDPWMMQVPCRYGTIYPHGGTTLVVEVDGRPITAGKLLSTGVCQLTQDGDHEKTFTFDVADFDAVVKIVQPRRRRQVSLEKRQQLSDWAKRGGFEQQGTARSQELAVGATIL